MKTTEELYILIFLHQTATQARHTKSEKCCISLYSYIKPQRSLTLPSAMSCCISLYSYIKPQHKQLIIFITSVVYPYIPTSNRNKDSDNTCYRLVVYPYIPTSNRNLHSSLFNPSMLYILIFLHQTATYYLVWLVICGCISLYSYIKPQRAFSCKHSGVVVYPYIPTSNRNTPASAVW